MRVLASLLLVMGLSASSFALAQQAKKSNWVEGFNVDKFTGVRTKFHTLTFDEVWSNNHKRDCEGGCRVWVWPDHVVADGYWLIAGGTKNDFPVRVRLGDEVFEGECQLSANRKTCRVALKGFSDKEFADELRAHKGEVAFEFTQTPNLSIGSEAKRVDNWNTLKGFIKVPDDMVIRY